MKTKTLFLFAALLLSLLYSEVYAFDFYNNGIYYYLLGKDKKNKVAMVTYGGDNNRSALYSGTVVIPETVQYKGKTYPVTKIGHTAFKECVNLKEVVIPNTVTIIDDYAPEIAQ